MTDPLVAFARRFGAPADREDAAELVEAVGGGEAPTDGFADALEATVADLDAEDEDHRRAAARTLYEVAGVAPGPVRERGVEFVDALDDPAARPYVAGALTTALGGRGPVESLVEDLRPAVRESPPSPAAVRYLSWIAKRWSRDAAAAESAVAAALTADDPVVREHATRFFAVAWEHHVAGREAAPALLDRTEDENPTTRANALTAVGHRVFEYREADETPLVDPAAVVAAAADHLDEGERVRFNAVAVLAESEHHVEGDGERYWPDYVDNDLASRVVGRLVECLDGESEALERLSGRALADAARGSPEALADHADALVGYAWVDDRPAQGWIRRAVRRASDARPAAFVPHADAFVERVRNDPDRDAITVVGNVAAADLDVVAEAVDPLVDRFTAPVRPSDRRPVGQALASFYRADPDSVPDWVGPLAAATEAEDRERRRLARRNPLQAVAETDPDAAATVLATACSRLDEPGAVSQTAVLSGVGDVDRRAVEPAVGSLVALVRDGDAGVAGHAVQSLHGLVRLDGARDLLEPARDPVDRRREEFEGRTRDRADDVVAAVDDPDEPDDAGDGGSGNGADIGPDGDRADGEDAGGAVGEDDSAGDGSGGTAADGRDDEHPTDDEQRTLRDWLPF
ncbi:hypothetical protein [Halosimplex pelagicum]|uniref:HEAT repeat domain-containing protein n=1 Tax=Halosimplex pelagicum TaxID=869886 RepID=A0A7D5ST93_9EURY|nr:hypothetical protein [Halosimplex pelagicum]QLH80327.1 hypothetical protein HZS54_01210 [Halosimplex pelagicum]